MSKFRKDVDVWKKPLGAWGNATHEEHIIGWTDAKIGYTEVSVYVSKPYNKENGGSSYVRIGTDHCSQRRLTEQIIRWKMALDYMHYLSHHGYPLEVPFLVYKEDADDF